MGTGRHRPVSGGNLRRNPDGDATDFFAPRGYTGHMKGGRGVRVYVDLVMAVNFLVDFLLLLGTNRLAGYPPGIREAVPAALLGGFYGGMCLVPGFRFLGSGLWRLVMLTVMAGMAFGWNRSAIQRGAVFVLLSMALGGIALGLGNGTFWMLGLAVGTVWLLCRAGFRGGMGVRSYVPVELNWMGKRLNLIALRDTGNTLRDPVTGEQILVAGADVARELLGLTETQLRSPVETVSSGVLPGLRLVPYRAVGQPGGMLTALRMSHTKIGKCTSSPLVAFAPEELGRGEVYRMLTGGAV